LRRGLRDCRSTSRESFVAWITNRFLNSERPSNAFGYGRFLDRAVVADLVDRDPVLAYYVAAYFEVRHAAACTAVQGLNRS
jgi:hypothetical protein